LAERSGDAKRVDGKTHEEDVGAPEDFDGKLPR